MAGRKISSTRIKAVKFPKEPMEQLKVMGEMSRKGEPIPMPVFFNTIRSFSKEKRKHHQSIQEKEHEILEVYGGFSQHDRVEFFSMLYDDFAANYDRHMGTETGHYESIKKVLGFAAHMIKLPMIDITAGTGEPLKHAIEMIWQKRTMRSPSERIVANEISDKMAEQAKRKHSEVEFTAHNALDLPWEAEFSTVLCSQTFHLISEEDKISLIRSIHRILAKNGIAIVIEEDPFRISETPSIEPVAMFLRAVAQPIKPRTLCAQFETSGFKNLEISAQYPIDEHHVMKVHLFEKY
ncbi:class I SAM-dependent methyltransferase [Candidatus Micrarchaeota archaeon]|nr:class I SAM-dependent methyltransferase [Candidatus Micrarchaeota archaeon]